MFKFVVLLLAAFTVGALAFDGDRIVGGQQARRGQFPFMVSILRQLPYTISHKCGGAILNDRAVLSSANCMGSSIFSFLRMRIAVGAHSRSFDGNGVLHTINRVIKHPDFNNDTRANDIAILQPKFKFTFNQFVAPIQLPSIDTPDQNNLPLIFTGWGQYRAGKPSENPKDFPDFLHFVNINSLKRQECINKLGGLGRLVHNNTICTIAPVHKGACVGDSGGPLINKRYELVGVASWRLPLCGEGSPDVYTRVFPHLRFIKQTIANLS